MMQLPAESLKGGVFRNIPMMTTNNAICINIHKALFSYESRQQVILLFKNVYF